MASKWAFIVIMASLVASTACRNLRQELSSTKDTSSAAANPGINGCADPNPCQGVDNSNGTCIAEPASKSGYTCACDEGRAWDGSACAGTGTAACVSIVAGAGGQGYSGDNGPAISATLNYPTGVSLDAAGNLYIADSYNRRLRRVDATTGIITTRGGKAVDGYVKNVVVAPSGNAYYATSGVVYEYNPAKNTTTRFPPGNFGFLDALAINPVSGLISFTARKYSRIGHDAVSYVYSLNLADMTTTRVAPWQIDDVSDSFAFTPGGDAFIIAGDIYKRTSNGELALWSVESHKPATGLVANRAHFNHPRSVAIDHAGNMLITDVSSHQVWLVEAQTGKLRLLAGTGMSGSSIDGSSPTKTELQEPVAAAFGPGGRSVFIADAGNHRVVKIMLECVGA